MEEETTKKESTEHETVTEDPDGTVEREVESTESESTSSEEKSDNGEN